MMVIQNNVECRLVANTDKYDNAHKKNEEIVSKMLSTGLDRCPLKSGVKKK